MGGRLRKRKDFPLCVRYKLSQLHTGRCATGCARVHRFCSHQYSLNSLHPRPAQPLKSLSPVLHVHLDGMRLNGECSAVNEMKSFWLATDWHKFCWNNGFIEYFWIIYRLAKPVERWAYFFMWTEKAGSLRSSLILSDIIIKNFNPRQNDHNKPCDFAQIQGQFRLILWA